MESTRELQWSKTMHAPAVGLWLLPAPRTVGSATFDARTLLYEAMAVLIGFQSVCFGLFARTFAVTEGAESGCSESRIETRSVKSADRHRRFVLPTVGCHLVHDCGKSSRWSKTCETNQLL